MARFIGTFKEFKQYLNDYVKNKVPALTKKFKTGTCERCGQKAVLEAAHVRGRGRDVIIKEAFEAAGELISGNVYDVNLDTFAQYVYNEHTKPDNFHFICRDCHREYDAKNSTVQESEFVRANKF